jgi:UrcA family protein
MYRILSASAAFVMTALMFAPAMAQSVTVSGSAPVASGSVYQLKEVRVSLDGIDLGTSQGAAAVFDRIDAAARVVCGERAGVAMNLARTRIFETCHERAVRYAVQAVDVPALTQIAAAR